MTSLDITCVQDARAFVAEGPVWSAADQVLWWIDIGGQDHTPSLNRLNPATGESRMWPMPEPLGSIALASDGRILIARRSGFYLFDPTTGRDELVAASDASMSQFNDGRCDAAGRFWVGTRTPTGAPSNTGAIYSLEHGRLRRHDVGPITLHNGTGFSPDWRRMYTAETWEGVIYVADFDLARGEVSNRRIFAKLDQGGADGGAVDAEGCYWSANVSGGRIVRFRPDGCIDYSIQLPLTLPTMVAFGGPNLDELYITTARHRLDATGRDREPQAGGIFRCHPGVKGLSEPLYEV